MGSDESTIWKKHSEISDKCHHMSGLCGRMLDKLIKMKDLQKGAVADFVGIDASTLSKYINGERMIPFENLIKLVITLELSALQYKLFKHCYFISFEAMGICKAIKTYKPVINSNPAVLQEVEMILSEAEERLISFTKSLNEFENNSRLSVDV